MEKYWYKLLSRIEKFNLSCFSCVEYINVDDPVC